MIPLWMQSVPLMVALLSAPLGYGVVRLVSWEALRAYRRELSNNPALHWTEKARLSTFARRAAVMLLLILPLCLGLGMPTTAGEFSLVSGAVLGSVAGLGSFLGAYLALRNLGKFLEFPSSSFLKDLSAFAFFAQGLLAVIAMIVGGRMLGEFIAEPRVSRLFVAVCVLPWAWPPLILRCFQTVGVLDPSRQLEQQLEPIFAQSNVRPRQVWVARTTVANALAYPIQKVIVITERLQQILSPDELSAVVAHELGHLAEGRRAWTRYSLVAFLGLAGFTSEFVPEDLYLHFAGGVGASTFLGLFWLQTWSQAREHDADAAALQASAPETYARALEKIYIANLLPAVQRGGNHPSLYDRMENAGITPDFPRPAPPPRRIPVALFLATFAIVIWPTIWPLAFQTLTTDRAGALAVTTHDTWPLGDLAFRAHQAGNLREAIKLYRRAEQLDPQSPWYPRNLMAVLDEAGQCDEARAASARSYAKAANDPEIYDLLGPAARCDQAASPSE